MRTLSFLVSYSLALIILSLSLNAQTNFKDLTKMSKSLMERQSFDSAAVFAELALKDAALKPGKRSQEYCGTLSLLADISYYKGNYQKSIEYSAEEKNIRKLLDGVRHQAYANCLHNLGECYLNIGEFESSLTNLEEALKIRKEIFGEKHEETAATMKTLGLLNVSMGNYNNAEIFLSKASAFFKTAKGMELEYSECLNGEGELFQIMGKYDQAESSFREAAMLIQKNFGDKDPMFASALNNLSNLYSESGKFEKALALNEKAMSILKEAGLEKQSDYINFTLSRGTLLVDLNRTREGEQTLENAMQMAKEYLGLKHPVYQACLQNLGGCYFSQSKFPEAEALLKEGLIAKKETSGTNHPEYARALYNLGVFYLATEDFPAAEKYLNEALKIREKNFGRQHEEVAVSLKSLGELYIRTGNYPAAEIALKETLQIAQAARSEKNQTYNEILNRMGLLYVSWGKYTEAEKWMKENIALAKELYGAKESRYALALNNLCGLYVKTYRYSAAEPVMKEAMEVYKASLGENNIEYASFLNNYGSLQREMKKYEEAEKYYKSALKIHESLFGRKNLEYALITNNLGVSYHRLGQPALAETMLMTSLGIINSELKLNFSILTEKEQELYFRTQEKYFNALYSFARSRRDEIPALGETMFNQVVRNKGLLLRSSTAMRTAIMQSNDSALIKKYNEWLNLKKESTKLYATEVSKRKSDPEAIEEKANALEKELVKSSQQFGAMDKIQNAAWKQIRDQLKAGEAAIEFIHFKDEIGSDSVKKTYYCALLVKNESQFPEIIDLFIEDELFKITGSKKETGEDYISGVYGKKGRLSPALYKLIWKPLDKKLDGIKTVYYSPSGLLHKISFDALSNEKGIYLCNNYKLELKSSCGKLLAPENFALDKNATASLYGDIDYDTPLSKADTSAWLTWPYLEGTKREAEKVKSILQNKISATDYYSGDKATEEIFKQKSAQSDIVHIATHGFFFPDPMSYYESVNSESRAARKLRGGVKALGVNNYLANKNPLMRSGLAFAGANEIWVREESAGKEDGVVSAQEVSSLDLRNTSLVVLSACETGLGDIKGTEGVYGLQRAFKMAGAKFIIMSLWQVPDAETVEFMENFYTQLVNSGDVKTSFYKAKQGMSKKYDPFYWAAFVLLE